MTSTQRSEILPRSEPEAEGISSSAIRDFLAAVDREVDSLHTFMLLRNGRVVAEASWAPYTLPQRHMLFSLSKSFTSTAAGLAIAEGFFALDDLVVDLLPATAPPPASRSELLGRLKVRHLLSMTTGQSEDSLPAFLRGTARDWQRAFFALPVEHEPGTYFVYNSGATYMVSAIIQQTTGLRVTDFLIPRLFDPLGISDPQWERSPEGIDTGGWGLSLAAEEIARFGQLCLDGGFWKGQRLLPEAWVREATSRQVANGSDPESDWAQGYGYQFWRCRHNAYRGDGAFGQYCVVMPEQNAVLAMTGGLGDMGAPLRLAWEHLLPAMGSAPAERRPGAAEGLHSLCACLRLRPAPGEPIGEPGEFAGRFVLDPNGEGREWVELSRSREVGLSLSIRDGGGTHVLPLPPAGEWATIESAFDLPTQGVLDHGASFLASRAMGVSAARTGAASIVVRLAFLPTPFVADLHLAITAERLIMQYTSNVAFGPRERKPIVGRRVRG